MKRIVPLAFLLIVPFTRADIITLKNGREITGDIVDNGPGGVLIEYHVTPTIKDQKLVPKDDIVRIVRVADDERAFKALGSLTVPPTVLDTSFYDALIDKKLPEFIAKYPYSTHLEELRKQLAALDAERSRIRRGERKIDGQWLTPAQLDADPYQSGAMLKFVRMKEDSLARDPVAALKGYELLEKNFPGAAVMPSAIPLALQMLDQLQDQLIQALANYPIIDNRRQQVLLYAQADEARDMRDAVQKEILMSKQASAVALADGSRFFPVFQNNKESLEALLTLVKSERTRLTELQKVPMSAGIAAEKESGKLLDQGNLKGAQDSYDASAKLWPANYNLAALKAKLDSATNSVSASKEGVKLLAAGKLKEARDQFDAAAKGWTANPDLPDLKGRLASADASFKATEECARQLDGGNLKEAQDQIDSALKLWPANPEIPSLKTRLDLAAKKPHK
jgi:hypothetical protein